MTRAEPSAVSPPSFTNPLYDSTANYAKRDLVVGNSIF